MCFCCCFDKPPGFDRKPTDAEEAQPPDKRPWTEYDARGDKQRKPPYKACAVRPCLMAGPVCCVLELQWCTACGDDADTTCDILCRCQLNRCKACICCGPQCDTPICANCCDCFSDAKASAKVTLQELVECDCFDCCKSRYAGCQLCCCHVTFVGVPVCCKDSCCVEEEEIYMDGDLKPCSIRNKTMARM